eukprot:tig00021493_g21853.t1
MSFDNRISGCAFTYAAVVLIVLNSSQRGSALSDLQGGKAGSASLTSGAVNATATAVAAAPSERTASFSPALLCLLILAIPVAGACYFFAGLCFNDLRKRSLRRLMMRMYMTGLQMAVHPLPFGARGARLDPVCEAVIELAMKGEAWGVCYCSAAEREGDEADCPICLESFSRELPPIVIPCGHEVCVECMRRLVGHSVGAERLTCSVCRRLFTSDELHVHGPGAPLPSRPRSPSPGPRPAHPDPAHAPPAPPPAPVVVLRGALLAAPDAAALEGPEADSPEAPKAAAAEAPIPGALPDEPPSAAGPEEGEARGPEKPLPEPAAALLSASH